MRGYGEAPELVSSSQWPGAGQGGSEVLHPWLQAEPTAILATLPEPEMYSFAENRRWERWQEGLSVRITLPESLLPLPS